MKDFTIHQCGRMLDNLIVLKSYRVPFQILIVGRTSRSDASTNEFDDIDFGKYYALAIGINNYKYITNLGTAVRDAKAFIDALSNNDGVIDGTRLFSETRRPVILNARQTPEYSDVRNADHDGGDFLFVRKR